MYVYVKRECVCPKRHIYSERELPKRPPQETWFQAAVWHVNLRRKWRTYSERNPQKRPTKETYFEHPAHVQKLQCGIEMSGKETYRFRKNRTKETYERDTRGAPRTSWEAVVQRIRVCQKRRIYIERGLPKSLKHIIRELLRATITNWEIAVWHVNVCQKRRMYIKKRPTKVTYIRDTRWATVTDRRTAVWHMNLRQKRPVYVPRDQISVCQKRPVYNPRDLPKRPTHMERDLRRDLRAIEELRCAIYMCVKRDVYIAKETYKRDRQKSPMSRALRKLRSSSVAYQCTSKETCRIRKRPTQDKRPTKETHAKDLRKRPAKET